MPDEPTTFSNFNVTWEESRHLETDRTLNRKLDLELWDSPGACVRVLHCIFDVCAVGHFGVIRVHHAVAPRG